MELKSLNETVQTKKVKPEKEKRSQRAVKFGLIDHKILKHSLRSVIRNKFSIVWFSVMGAINLLLLAIFAFVPAFSQSSIFTVTIVWFFGFGITQMIYNLVSLNKVFSIDDEIGIVSLEIRKGRGPAMIFFSRLLGQKIVIWSFMMIYMLLMFAACLLNNNLLFETKYLFVFAWVPIDLVLTGFFLVLFSFKRYRLAVGIGSILVTLVLAAPLAEMVNVILVSTNDILSEAFNSDGNLKTYITDSMFAIINSVDDKGNNVVYKLMHEMNEENLNTYDYLELYSGIDEEGNPIPDNDDTSRMNTAIDAMFSQGLFTDEKLFGEDGTFKTILGDDGYYIEKNEGSAFKDTFLYKVNEDVNKAIRADIDDYYDSAYSNVLRMSKSQYKYTLQSLKDVIDVINNDKQFQKFSGLKELNKLVYDYVKTNPHILRKSDFASVTTRSQPFKTIYEFNNGGYGYSDEAQFTEYANYKTPSGLRLWNQIVMQFVGTALTYESPKEFVDQAKYQNMARLDPWGMSFWTMLGGTDNSNPLFQSMLGDVNSSKFNYGSLYNYSRFYATRDEDDNTNSIPKFDIKNMTPSSKVKGVEYKVKGHSPAGYNITILIFGIALIGLAYVLYRVRLRRQ